MAAPTTTRDLLADDTVAVVKSVRSGIPSLPKVKDDLLPYTWSSSKDFLAYMICQIAATKDKDHVMRCICAAVSCILQSNKNMAGATKVATDFVQTNGVMAQYLEDIADDTTPTDGELDSNFPEAEPVLASDVFNVMQADTSELAFYIAILILAGVKRPEEKNLTAFNDKRRAAIKLFVPDDLVIFVDQSPFLSLEVLNLVHTSFNSWILFRKHLVHNSLVVMRTDVQSYQRAFAGGLSLLQNQMMTAIAVIKEAVVRYPWIATEFPECRSDLNEIRNALNVIESAPAHLRPFLKAIHGADYVPVTYAAINNILGICREVLIATYPTFANYAGGMITEKQRHVVAQRMRYAIQTPPSPTSSRSSSPAP